MRREYGLFFFLLLSAFLALRDFHPLERLDWKWYDAEFRYEISHENVPPASKDLVLVRIDQDSITEKRPWPFRPRVYSDFLGEVEKGKPGVVYIDTLFEAAPQISQTEYETLLQKMREYGNVILPLTISKNGTIERPTLQLEKSVQGFGIPVVIQESDGIVRRANLLLNEKRGEPIPSIPLLIAGAYEGNLKKAKPAFSQDGAFDWYLPLSSQYASKEQNTNLIPSQKEFSLGFRTENDVIWESLVIPQATAQPDLFINYDAALKKNEIPFWQVADRKIDPKLFAEKIVILYIANDISDSFFTPLSRGFSPQDKTPGGEIIGYAVNTILSRSFIRRPGTQPGDLEKWIAIVSLFLFFLLLLRTGVLPSLAVYFLFLIAYFSLAFYLFHHNRLWIGYARLIFSSAILFGGSLAIERISLFQLMSRLIPGRIAGRLEKAGLKIGGEEITGTAMFVDMAGYTSMTEKSTLKETFEALKNFHEQIEKTVAPFGGIICDWQGDGVLIFFSNDSATAYAVPQPEKNAVKAAIAMKERFAEKGTSLGIGVATGKVLWGFLGTSRRAQPTAIGDPVNLASRLQGVGKILGTTIAADEKTFQATRRFFAWENKGAQSVKGKAEPVVVYSPVVGES